MSEYRAPVYQAGQGFEPGSPAPIRWKLPTVVAAILLVSATLAWQAWGPDPAAPVVDVTSEPSGARILLDLLDTGQDTPARLELPPAGVHGVQVQLGGHVSRPLVWSALCDTLKPGLRVHFLLEPVAAPGSTPPPAESASSPVPEPETREFTRSPLNPPIRPAPPVWQPTQGDLPASLQFLGWDSRYRCRVNGEESRPDARGRLVPGRSGTLRVQVELARSILLDTMIVVEQGNREYALLLPDRNRFVLVITRPVEGEILIGDRVVGTGEALLPRSMLPQDVRFARVQGHLEPASIGLGRDAPTEVTALYLPEQGWSYPANGREGAIHLHERGVWFEGSGFTLQSEGGPRTKDGSLRFGRARNDRRPWGSGQAVFTVELPPGVHPGMPARLDMEAFDTGENFPMSLRDHATLTVLFNGVVLARDVKLEPAARVRSWPVSRYLQEGINRIELRGSESATSWAALRSLRLELKR